MKLLQLPRQEGILATTEDSDGSGEEGPMTCGWSVSVSGEEVIKNSC